MRTHHRWAGRWASLRSFFRPNPVRSSARRPHGRASRARSPARFLLATAPRRRSLKMLRLFAIKQSMMASVSVLPKLCCLNYRGKRCTTCVFIQNLYSQWGTRFHSIMSSSVDLFLRLGVRNALHPSELRCAFSSAPSECTYYMEAS